MLCPSLGGRVTCSTTPQPLELWAYHRPQVKRHLHRHESPLSSVVWVAAACPPQSQGEPRNKATRAAWGEVVPGAAPGAGAAGSARLGASAGNSTHELSEGNMCVASPLNKMRFFMVERNGGDKIMPGDTMCWGTLWTVVPKLRRLSYFIFPGLGFPTTQTKQLWHIPTYTYFVLLSPLNPGILDLRPPNVIYFGILLLAGCHRKPNFLPNLKL